MPSAERPLTGVPPFVGRAGQLEVINEAVARAARGHGALVVVSGEPGIGKTRLVREAIADIGGTGTTIVWASGWEGDDAPPYWPWMQLARELRTKIAGADDLIDGLDRRALAVVLPELTDEPPPPVQDQGAARARLFAAVVDLLRAAVTTAALVVLVIDDLQWVDEASLLLLRHVSTHVPSLPLAIICTHRQATTPTDHARAELMASLSRTAQTVHLGGLEPHDIAELAAGMLGRDPSDDWSRMLAARTRGNPFFATEVLRLVVARGDPAAANLVGVPPSVVAVVTQRVASLPRPVQEVLVAAAVVGEQFTLGDLEAAGLETGAIVDAVDVAAAIRLVTTSERGFGFSHDLVREALYESLGPAAAAKLHRTIGLALEEASGPPEVLARHFLAAVGLGETARAVSYCVAAGEAALARLAHEDAAAWFERALAITDVPAIETLPARLGRAEAHRRAGHTTAAHDDLDAVITESRRASDAVAFARAALGVQRLGYRSGQLREASITLLEEALTRLGDCEPDVRAQVLSALALELWSHAWERADEARLRSEEAPQLAEATGSAGTLARGLEARYTVSWAPEFAEERAGIAARMAGAARASGDGELLATAELLLATARLEMADPRWRDALERFFDAGSALRSPRMEYLVLTRRAALALVLAEVEVASALIDDAAALGRRIGEPDAIYADYHLRSELLRFSNERGRLLDRQLPLRTSSVSLFGHVERPIMLLDGGYVEEARAAFDDAARIPFELVKRDWIFLHNLADLAEAAVRLDAIDVALRCYETMLPYAGMTCVATALVCFGGAVDLHLGRLALHLDRPADAVAHLEAAAAAHDRLGAPMWAEASRALLRDARAALSMASARGGMLARENKVWRLEWSGADAHVADSKGMHDLAVLLTRPGVEVPAGELYQREAADVAAMPADRGDEVIDAAARAAYRRRLAQLDEDLEEAESNHDLARAERLSMERDALLDELRRNFDLKGRPRRLGDLSERARKAVSARIRDAIKAIDAALPDLGAHLRASVRTGTYCSYQPPEPATWDVRQI